MPTKCTWSCQSNHPGFEVDIILLPKDDVEQSWFFEKMIFGQENPYKEIPISDFKDVNGKLYYTAFGTNYEQVLESEDYGLIKRTICWAQILLVEICLVVFYVVLE